MRQTSATWLWWMRTGDNLFTRGDMIDFAASTEQISNGYLSEGEYRLNSYSGTSASASAVSGVALLLIDAYPALFDGRPDLIRNRIGATVVKECLGTCSQPLRRYGRRWKLRIVPTVRGWLPHLRFQRSGRGHVTFLTTAPSTTHRRLIEAKRGRGCASSCEAPETEAGSEDDDGDGINNACDNCRYYSNAAQDDWDCGRRGRCL